MESVAAEKPKPSIRHAEKRRTSTCKFADRVAKLSIEYYKVVIPEADRPPQTCMATIVAHFADDGSLKVLSMGVGTKFLSTEIIEQEQQSKEYGLRVRDMHAEVLARRSFRARLTTEILNDLKGSTMLPSERILKRSPRSEDDSVQFSLRDGVTLHLYTSSAPCGNATMKKFAKMQKEKFQDGFGDNEWPQCAHDHMIGHSVKLGQFALLVKRDRGSEKMGDQSDNSEDEHERKKSRVDDTKSPTGKKAWPATTTDDWCPAGTSIVQLNRGSIHTCSDKICRWNVLGLEGSLLSSLLSSPLYLSTITVGRKFSEVICRRASCCRVGERWPSREASQDSIYCLHHPVIMGTGVLMDETGVVETDQDKVGQDVRFHSPWTWAAWTSLQANNENQPSTIECIDGSSGFLVRSGSSEEPGYCRLKDESRAASICTKALQRQFFQCMKLAVSTCSGTSSDFRTLRDLRNLKQQLSPIYEAAKEELLTKHLVFGSWKRRFASSK